MAQRRQAEKPSYIRRVEALVIDAGTGEYRVALNSDDNIIALLCDETCHTEQLTKKEALALSAALAELAPQLKD